MSRNLRAIGFAIGMAGMMMGCASATSKPTETPAVIQVEAQHAPTQVTTMAAETKPARKVQSASIAAPKMDTKDPTKMQKAFSDKHDKLVALAKAGNIDLYFEGDSITENWKSQGKTVWPKEFGGWKAANFGIGGDRTQHVLWRLDNGELDGVNPKAVVLMIGTNNSGDNTGEEIADGVAAIVKKFREKAPQAKILVCAIFPRGDITTDVPTDKKRKVNEDANKIIAGLDDGDHVKFINFNDKFPPVGTPEFEKVFPDKTHLHPGPAGYQIWADAIKPTLIEWLGAPSANP